jgi:excisionase family DNA binding protein
MTHSVKDLCKRFGVSAHTVLVWIRAGELRALNVGRSRDSSKPRWRVTQEALEALRTTSLVPLRAKRRKRPMNVIEYYS